LLIALLFFSLFGAHPSLSNNRLDHAVTERIKNIISLQRVWSSGKWNNNLGKYVWAADVLALTVQPSGGVPFYYAAGALETRGRTVRRCLTQCLCYRKDEGSGGPQQSYVRAHCQNDKYHAICSKYGTVSISKQLKP